MFEITNGLIEFVFSWDPFGHVELAANVIVGFKQRDIMAPFGGGGGEGQTRRAGSHDGNALWCHCSRDGDFSFVTSKGVDHATGAFVLEHEIEACLVAGNARVDGLRCAGSGFVDPIGVGKKGAGHGHHVGVASGQDCFSGFGHIDSV